MTGLISENAEGEFRRGKIFAAIELSKAKWVVALGSCRLGQMFKRTGGSNPSRSATSEQSWALRPAAFPPRLRQQASATGRTSIP